MPELHPEQWGLTLLDVYAITLGIGLALPLLLRFVLARRPIAKGWAFAMAALFCALSLVVFDTLGGQSRTYGAFVLIAIVAYLILAAGRKGKPPVFEESESAGPQEAAADSAGSSQAPDGGRKDMLPIGFLLIDDTEETGEQKTAHPEVPGPKVPDTSPAGDDAEIHRYDIAWREVEAGNQHRGLWARAFAMNDGDEVKTKIQYLKERTEFLKEQEQRQEAERKTRELREREIRKEKQRQDQERAAQLKKQEQKKEEERQAEELRQQALQKELDRVRNEQAERLNRELQRQKEERWHTELLQRVAQRQSENVNLLQDDINEPDKWNEFKLISAAQFQSDEHVFILLAAGANPMLRDGFGHTARDYAKEKGRTEITRHLEIAERLWKQRSQNIQFDAA
jgi:hypothetical protein